MALGENLTTRRTFAQLVVLGLSILIDYTPAARGAFVTGNLGGLAVNFELGDDSQSLNLYENVPSVYTGYTSPELIAVTSGSVARAYAQTSVIRTPLNNGGEYATLGVGIFAYSSGYAQTQSHLTYVDPLRLILSDFAHLGDWININFEFDVTADGYAYGDGSNANLTARASLAYLVPDGLGGEMLESINDSVFFETVNGVLVPASGESSFLSLPNLEIPVAEFLLGRPIGTLYLGFTGNTRTECTEPGCEAVVNATHTVSVKNILVTDPEGRPIEGARVVGSNGAEYPVNIQVPEPASSMMAALCFVNAMVFNRRIARRNHPS